jgi:hypothetical protein
MIFIFAFDEIYNFLVLNFSFDVFKMFKKIKQSYNGILNHEQALVALEKSYLPYMVLNGDTF